ncbi:uncharacterized protein G2W53_015408 [Senna tora]|uniref:Uncharacterized protein n=1 Tax=Senna tora TaxID=362788 RepID=A0A834WUR1_9FABA|nr:uncharacterized protein G2W53_015408 [Senna tora]
MMCPVFDNVEEERDPFEVFLFQTSRYILSFIDGAGSDGGQPRSNICHECSEDVELKQPKSFQHTLCATNRASRVATPRCGLRVRAVTVCVSKGSELGRFADGVHERGRLTHGKDLEWV